jgi:hypothetical protein
MDESPLPFRAHGVLELAAKKTHVVCLQKVLGIGGVPLELAVEKGNSPTVLKPAKNEFLFAFALAFLINARQSYGQGNEQKCDHHQDGDERVPISRGSPRLTAGWGVRLFGA